MTVLEILPDADQAVRMWARSLDLGAVAGRIFFGLPTFPAVDDTRDPVFQKAFPVITIARYGGVPDPYLPVDRANYTFNCWGTSNQQCSRTAYLLMSHIRSLTSATPAGTAARIDGGLILSGPRWLADPAIHISRHILDAQFLIRPNT